MKILTKTQQSACVFNTCHASSQTSACRFTAPCFCVFDRKKRLKNHAKPMQSGFTLFELMITIALGCVVLVLAAPSFNHLLHVYEIRRFEHLTMPLLSDARMSTLLYRQRVLVCGSTTGTVCNQDWASGLMVFIDLNLNGTFEKSADALLRFEPLALRYGQVSWRGFGNRDAIRYESTTGTPNASNGTLSYCTTTPTDNRQIIISRMGRVRPSVDQNKDGIYEDANGQPIQCP